MSRSSVVPWWGRLLPWVFAVVAAGCLGWSLGIDGWRLSGGGGRIVSDDSPHIERLVGPGVRFPGSARVRGHDANSEADRGQR